VSFDAVIAGGLVVETLEPATLNSKKELEVTATAILIQQSS
jgi:hypothetical protein